MNKIDKIQLHLKNHGSISKMIAADLYYEYNLSERIARLRLRGLEFRVDMIPREDKQAYANYVLVR